MKSIWSNLTPFHGDNLEFVCATNLEIEDLIALAPSLNQARDFHATPDSLAAGAELQDRWSWELDFHKEWFNLITDDHPDLMTAIQSSRKTRGDMRAFLYIMAVRLQRKLPTLWKVSDLMKFPRLVGLAMN